MTKLSIEELKKRADKLRKQVDEFEKQHGKYAGISVGREKPVEEITLEELAESCKPETIGGIAKEELDRWQFEHNLERVSPMQRVLPPCCVGLQSQQFAGSLFEQSTLLFFDSLFYVLSPMLNKNAQLLLALHTNLE